MKAHVAAREEAGGGRALGGRHRRSALDIVVAPTAHDTRGDGAACGQNRLGRAGWWARIWRAGPGRGARISGGCLLPRGRACVGGGLFWLFNRHAGPRGGRGAAVRDPARAFLTGMVIGHRPFFILGLDSRHASGKLVVKIRRGGRTGPCHRGTGTRVWFRGVPPSICQSPRNKAVRR